MRFGTVVLCLVVLSSATLVMVSGKSFTANAESVQEETKALNSDEELKILESTLIPALEHRARLVEELGDNHPSVLTMDKKIADIQSVLQHADSIVLIERVMKIKDVETGVVTAKLVARLAALEQRVAELESGPAKVQFLAR